jgi:hypothetical protein
MNVDPFPQLIPVALTGDPTCGYRPVGATGPCGRPAVWHVAWTLVTPADFSLLCDGHMTAADKEWVYADRHPAEVICDMPGFAWLTSTPSHCIIVTTDMAEQALAAAAQPDGSS